ncbi:MAG: 2-iminobutanoate/2-iminopropanoate deaminase [Gammaproteobacteria bacterium]|jgi:2-iminobutanoate/2-iminopropanoate deaminase
MIAHEIIGDRLALADGTKLPLSKAVRAGDFVFLSGQLALDSQGRLNGDDIETQTRQCIENIQVILALANCDLGNIIKSTVWLVNKSDYSGFNRIYAEFFKTDFPTRSAICSTLMLPGALVEIEVVAFGPGST